MFLDSIKSLRWTDYLYYALLDPRSLARLIVQSDRPLIRIAFLIPVLSAAVQIISSSLLAPQNMFFYTKMTYGLILLSMLNILFVFFLAWLIDTSLQLRGRAGNIKVSLTIINFSFLPLLFLLPVVTIFNVTGFAPSFFRFIAYSGFVIWMWLIIVRSISEVHGLSFPKALAVCLVPFAAILFIAVCVSLLFAGLLAGFVQSLQLLG
jgi:hypothetical protein